MRTPATNYDQNETITYSHTQNCSSKLSNFSVLHENVSRFSSNAPSLASSPHSQNPSLNPPGIIVPPQLLKGAYLWNRCENVNWISPFHVSQKILRSAHISGTFHSHHKHPTHHRAFASPLDQMVTHFSTLQSKHVCHHVPRPNGISQRSHQQFIKNYSTASRIVESSPNFIQPYLRLIRMDKPIGTWLLYWPCTWSIALAAQPGTLPDLYLLALFGAGAFFMRGSGCIINDMWDKDFDEKVERTKTRPLANGDLTQFQALVFLGSQLSCALAILLQLNLYSVILGASSMALVVTYPLAKRYTYWPQLILGLTLNWGVLLAWSAIQGEVNLACGALYMACVFYTIIYDTIYSHQHPSLQPAPLVHNLRGLTFNYGVLLGYSAVAGWVNWAVCLPMYFASVLWTLVYDTVYAHQDKYDDLLIGVKSAAIRLGEKTKPVLTAFTAAMASGLIISGQLSDMTWPYYIAVAITTGRLAQQVYSTNLDVADQCAHAFRGNFYLGAIMFIGIALSNFLKQEITGDTEGTSVEKGLAKEEVEDDKKNATEELVKAKKDTVFFMPR
ncbi:hypothetical protein RRG08_000052 [Elysia crispata]|uniref:4-hydroxybenzoate polyprenyltransferase, mitochondrial n=1 Tax=Elysia crispata TaxID=231223 RepID=A0AAE0Y5W5_9GAST|nr:hypothetical protein RRG08_000052 [Elysia crispata]